MMESRSYHSVHFDIAKGNPARIVFIIAPSGLVNELKKWAEPAAAAHDCSIAMISQIDWNGSLTPWEAAGVFKKEKPFGGKAEMFLRELTRDLIPNIEACLGARNPERILAGISLSGLFAVWACHKATIFSSIISISGSLWFDRMSEWVAAQSAPHITRAYFSLGEKEKRSLDKRISTVEDATRSIAENLSAKGVSVVFDLCEGSHFAAASPKLGKALENLLGHAEEAGEKS